MDTTCQAALERRRILEVSAIALPVNIAAAIAAAVAAFLIGGPLGCGHPALSR
jgi:hypothetical protein